MAHALPSDPTDPTEEGDLPKDVFIALMSSLGSVVALAAIIIIVIFTLLCCREYYKRKSRMKRDSDSRVGLLRPGKGEEEEANSDQEEEMVHPNYSTTTMDTTAVHRESKPSLLAALANGSKVTPAPTKPLDSVIDPEAVHQPRRRTKSDKRNGQEVSGEKKTKMTSKADDVGSEEGGSGGSHTEVLNSGVDANSDKHQLLETKAAKAKRLGKSVSYFEQLSKSSPLSKEAMMELMMNATSTSNNPITREYKAVPSNAADLPNQSPAERAKNRYRNVLPNPHSAVTLNNLGTDGSTYINANFIRGLHGEERSYIATQGPIYDTMADFWRMVWENNASIIVMLTNLIESGRHKCVKYWPPSNDTKLTLHGPIEVKNSHEDVVPGCYTLSLLTIKNIQSGETRDVYHFWCTAWPDFGIPREAEPILKLRGIVNSHRSPNTGPIVVHCSAGLGRSGTFIAIDMGMQQYEEEGVVDPLKYLCKIRQDRGGMIQTPDQYLFVYKALTDHMN